jgi:hypothetical protein
MSDNNTDRVTIRRWLRRRKKRGNGKRKHWVHPFFRDNLSSGAYIVSKELNQDPELFKSFYRMSIESFSLLVDIIEPQVRKKDTNFRTAVSAEERLLITLRKGKFMYLLLQIFHSCLNKYRTIARGFVFTLLYPYCYNQFLSSMLIKCGSTFPMFVYSISQ